MQRSFLAFTFVVLRSVILGLCLINSLREGVNGCLSEWGVPRHSPRSPFASCAPVCCIAVVVFTWSDVLRMMGCLMLADATTPILLQCLSRFVLLEFAL